jgi:signal transduction histidine kinase
VKSILPRNLLGQLALVMAGALLVASAVNFVLLLGERQRSALIEQSGPPMARFADIAAIVFADPSTDLIRPNGIGRQQGPGRYSLQPINLVEAHGLSRDATLEARLREAMTDAGVTPRDVRASTRTLLRPDRISNAISALIRARDRASGNGPGDFRPPRDRDDRAGPPGRDGPFAQHGPFGRDGPPGLDPPPVQEWREILLSVQLPDKRWLTSFTLSPESTRGDAFLVAASTFVIFICVFAAALWVASRLSRPLRDLAAAAGRVGDADEPQPVVVRGPGDVRQTIEAFNAMSRRVSQLLREKDVMLGALGHDLRTPLSSLRIRLETMEPEAERLKAVKTIEEASDLLEDILELSRRGKSSEPERAMDVSVLVEDVVEDYAETGAPVTLISTQKSIAVCRPVLMRRALRNLIDNATTYGGLARLTVETGAGMVSIHVDDDGPGMTPDALSNATDPFYRGEASRNRSTGGAGLGLTLCEAIARAHRGSLTLQNRTPRGLRATVQLPLAGANASAAEAAKPATPK